MLDIIQSELHNDNRYHIARGKTHQSQDHARGPSCNSSLFALPTAVQWTDVRK